ncbi:DUF4145 domain-containing protein [uncultured Microbulbifer sp.]|uniref:DUF4145 domain-containing protein n=1 Tax=uncultured Microbulbifer sp. TaxID=348147 RepID=UPI00261FA8D5|nr:DUF4145 domain-containing protein [uncultured Microbulbifer sp.]
MSEENYKIEKAHCNQCLHETRHFVVALRDHSGSAPANEHDPYCEYEVSWRTVYKMLECCGCENVSLEKKFYFSEYDEIEEEYYPPKVSRQTPKWLDQLPEEWYELLKEIYVALHANSRRLAIMGTRTLLDLYMNEQVGDVGGFAKKLQVLEDSGQISKPNKSTLEAALEVGHAASHRGHKAKTSEVNQVIDIAENLLQGYLLTSGAESLRASAPPRA